MKTVCKKLFSLMLVAILLVSAVPFQAAATEGDGSGVTVKLYPNYPADTGMVTATTIAGGVLDVDALRSVVDLNVQWVNAETGANVTGETVYTTTTMLAPQSAYEASKKPVHEHSYTMTETPATCLEAGVKTYTCECGDSYTEAIPATGHGRVVDNADGSRVCLDCNTVIKAATPTTPANGKLTVYVYAYNSNNEAREIGTVVLDEESSYTLNKALAEHCFAKVGLVNYEEYKWQGASGTVDLSNGKNVDVNLLADPIMTPGNKKIVTLKLMNNDGTSDRQLIECLAGDEILTAIAAGIKAGDIEEPERKGYKLAGWSFDMNCSDDVNRDDVITKDMTIYAEWERIPETNKYDVTLRVYTNGDGVHVDRTFDMSGYGSVITRDEVKSVINKHYTAKKGYSLAYYGLFTNKTWDDGDYDMDDAVSSIDVNKDGKTVIYVMVKNVKTVAADPSNPKTGDGIFAVMSVMMGSGAALVSLNELRKRKMI